MSRAATETRDHPAGSPASSIISVRDLSMTRTRPTGERVPAFEHLSFEVDRGEFVCLIGPSGSGKTSTLSVIAGLERPTSGEVLVEGRPVTGPGPDRAVLFQEPALFPWLSVRGNLDLALRLAGVAQDEREDRAFTWLTRMAIERSADLQPHELSAGMRQRAALARALAADPDVFLADEPFGALDAQARELLQNEVQRVWMRAEGAKTFLFVTHNVREAVVLADRVLVMSAAPGRLLEEFRIHAPRPRDLDDVLVARVVSEIHALLMREVDKGVAREMGG
jgi:NitT/TauT family transport system ATP-binding protein